MPLVPEVFPRIYSVQTRLRISIEMNSQMSPSCASDRARREGASIGVGQRLAALAATPGDREVAMRDPEPELFHRQHPQRIQGAGRNLDDPVAIRAQQMIVAVFGEVVHRTTLCGLDVVDQADLLELVEESIHRRRSNVGVSSLHDLGQALRRQVLSALLHHRREDRTPCRGGSSTLAFEPLDDAVDELMTGHLHNVRWTPGRFDARVTRDSRQSEEVGHVALRHPADGHVPARKPLSTPAEIERRVSRPLVPI